jgi:hypothetical protein
MPCERFTLPNGVSGIMCSQTRRRRCSGCGALGVQLLCDWKVKGRRSGTCDRPICARCSHSPAPGKDLCPEHAAEWARRGAPVDRLKPEPTQDDLFIGGVEP